MLASLRPDPTLLKVRSILEKTLEKKLEIMGIAKVSPRGTVCKGCYLPFRYSVLNLTNA